MADTILFSNQPLAPQTLQRELAGEEVGAVVTFAGVVRRTEGDLPLRGIDYQAYESMARRALHALLVEAHTRWPSFQAVIAHRTGVVAVGEPSVWIGVATRHRGDAFDVARFLIDGLKAQAPIWKHRHLPLDAGAQGGQD
jgi:molybdopterin synthase catalytic subunit